jgi:hypothetical protein
MWDGRIRVHERVVDVRVRPIWGVFKRADQVPVDGECDMGEGGEVGEVGEDGVDVYG